MHAFCLSLLVFAGSSHGASILGIFPVPMISHQLPYQSVMRALASRGHNVTVISTHPLQTPPANYTDIDLSFMRDIWRQTRDLTAMQDMSPYEITAMFTQASLEWTQLQMSSKVMKEFIKSAPKFDLVLIESLMFQSYYGLVHHVGSPPMVGILSMAGYSSDDLVANPKHPAYDPETLLPYSDHMDFWERMNNMLLSAWIRYNYYWNILPNQDKVMRQHFGEGLPHIEEMNSNFSLVMISSHWSTSYPRPVVPALIELGSLHVQAEPKPLPKDLAEFLDGATDGFVYFSLGSNVRSDKLPELKRRQFLEAFAQLPQRVLWKWESDTLPGQPDNVMVAKWLPQQDVLAHRNIRVFMMQGGLQSLGEATHHGVPLVGIPFISDQAYNVHKIVSAGIGLKIDLKTATSGTILQAVQTVINDPQYRENMKKYSAISKDQPETPLERAVWWTEYVLRHNGAKHLRSAALDLTWYQYLLLDVIAVMVLALVLLVIVVYLIVRKLYCSVCKLTSKSKLE